MALGRWGLAVLVGYGLWWGIGTGASWGVAKLVADRMTADGQLAPTVEGPALSPARFGVRLADVTGDNFHIPRADLTSASLAPTGVRFQPRSETVIETILGPVTITADTIWGAARARLWPFLDLGKVDGAVTNLDVQPHGLRVMDATFAMTPADARGTYDLNLEAEGVSVAGGGYWLSVPLSVDAIDFTGLATFDKPLRLHGPDEMPPALMSLSGMSMAVDTGSVAFTATGDLAFDYGCNAQGKLDLSVSDWSAFVRELVAVGAITAEGEAGVTNLGKGIADAEGRVTLPLTVHGNALSIGFFQIGQLPLAC